MSTNTLALFLRHLALAPEVRHLGTSSDHDLLAAYELEHGQAAFTELMRRHGPMVLRTCRRVLGRGPDAEDAFQATFVLLARKTSELRREAAGPLCLGGWLHRVAYRTALDVLAKLNRRRAHERQAGAVMHSTLDPSAEATWNEIQPILDAELDALPEQSRRLLIACYLQDKTYTEAAAELGLPRGSVAWRLEQARTLLVERLARRGIVVSGAVLAVLLEETAKGAGVPAVLFVYTVETVRRLAENAAGALSSPVAQLVKVGLARTARGWTHWIMALASGLGLLGAGLVASQYLAVRPDQPPNSAAVAAERQAREDDKSALVPVESPRKGTRRTKPLRLDLFGAPLPEQAVARMGMARFRHLGPVSSVAYSPDDKTIASASHDNTVRLWDAATGEERRRLRGHDGAVTAVAYAPDGKTLATASADNTIRLWDAVTGKQLHCLKGHQQPVTAIAFSPNQKELASASWDQSVRLWDTARGREVRRLEGHTAQVQAVAYAADGQTLASGGRDQTVRLWNVGSGEEIGKLEGHKGVVAAVAFSPDGKSLASGDAEGAFHLWDAATRRKIRSFQAQSLPGQFKLITALVFAADGQTLVSGSEDWTVRFWDVKAGTELRSLKAHLGRCAHVGHVSSLAFSHDGQSLVSGGWDHAVRRWEVATGKPLQNWEGHQEYIGSVVFSPDGRTVASASIDNTVRLWDAASGKQLRQLDGPPDSAFYAVAFSPDGKTLATGSHDKAIRLWDAATGQEIRKQLTSADSTTSVAFSPDGQTLAAAGSDQTVLFWNLAADERSSRWRTPAGIWKLAFSPDGKTLALAHWDKTIVLRDVTTGRAMGKLEGHQQYVASVAYSPDGKKLASASWDGTVRLWDVAAAKELRRLEGHEGGVQCAAFEPRGRYVASGGKDGTVRLWELASGRECARFTGHDGVVCSLAFSPDGRRLASGGGDHTVLIWDLTGRSDGSVPAARLRTEELERLWSDLASVDAAKAYRAGWFLASVPDRAVDLFQRRLRDSLKPVDPLRFVLGQDAANYSALKTDESARLPMLEELRIVRAVAVLEEIGTAKAKELLREMGERARQAQVSIERELGRQP